MSSDHVYQILQSKPHNQHYLKRYCKFISECQFKNLETVPEHTHAHHICPRSMFPDYQRLSIFTWNSVKLTPRQHFIAHYMLYKAFDTSSMLVAFICMRSYNTRSRTYEKHRIEFLARLINSKRRVKNLITNEISTITKEEWDNRDSHIVGVSYGSKRSKAHCELMSKILTGKNTNPKSISWVNARSGVNHERFKGYYVTPDDIKVTSFKQLKALDIVPYWYKKLNAPITKCLYNNSVYLKTKWSWDELENKTFADLGFRIETI